jgi:hypothetical protein
MANLNLYQFREMRRAQNLPPRGAILPAREFGIRQHIIQYIVVFDVVLLIACASFLPNSLSFVFDNAILILFTYCVNRYFEKS